MNVSQYYHIHTQQDYYWTLNDTDIWNIGDWSVSLLEDPLTSFIML